MATPKILVPFLLAALTFSGYDVEKPTGSVRGLIYNEVGQPKTHALVEVLGTEKYLAYTDESGHFQIDRIPAGHQYFRVLHPDMNQATFDVMIAAGDTITIKPIYMRPFGLSDSQAAAESIGVDVPWAADVLTCDIRPTQKIFHVGDHPDFKVSITNRGKEGLDLVWPVKGRFPQAEIDVELRTIAVGHVVRRNGEVLRGTALLLDGITSALSADDFVHLEPGQTIDPYAKGSKPTVLTGTFEQPGIYRATFTYSTKQPDVRRWLGFGQSTVDPSVSKLFRTVPMVELTATTDFEVAD